MNKQLIKNSNPLGSFIAHGVFGLWFFTVVISLNGMDLREENILSPNITSNPFQSLHRSHSMDDFYPSRVIDYFGTSRGEYEECQKALSAGRAAARSGDFQKAYELYKKWICGAGDSEYTRIFTEFVDISIEAYCACKHLDPLTKTQFGYREIERFNATYHPEYIVPVLKKLRDQEPDKANALKLQKEVMFWLRFAQDEEVYEGEIIEQKNILEKLRD